jgi:hypothetical protein
MSAITKLEKYKRDASILNRYINVEERAASLVQEAKAAAAPVREELKATNDRLLDCLREAQSEGYDGIRIIMGDDEYYIKRKASRSARACKISHLEAAFDDLTPEVLSLEQTVGDESSMTDIFWAAIMRALRDNDELYTVSNQLVLDLKPIQKKTVVGEDGDDAVRVIDADPAVVRLVNRRRELEASKAGLQKQVKVANTKARNMRGKVDLEAVRRVVEESDANGKQIQMQDADGKRTKLACHQKKVTPSITVTTLKGGLLADILAETFEGVDFGEDPSEWLGPEVKSRFLEVCEIVIQRYREDNTRSTDVLRTTKQRDRKRNAKEGSAVFKKKQRRA